MSGSIQKPLLVSCPRARELIDVGNTKFWDLVKRGVIKTVPVGNRQMVVYSSLEQLTISDAA